MGPHARPHWHEAFDAQMALWRWYRATGGTRWMRESYRANMKTYSKEISDTILGLYDAEMGRLLDCDPIYVSEEMCELVDAARQSFAPEPLYETDLVTPRGFMWYAKPLVMQDRYDIPVAIKAVSWTRGYAFPSDANEEEFRNTVISEEKFLVHGDRMHADEMQGYVDEGLITPHGVAITLYAERDHYLSVTQEREQRLLHGVVTPDWAYAATSTVPVVPFHLTPWIFNEEFGGSEVDENGRPTAASEWWTMVQTSFRLMQQRVSAKTHHRTDRASRREAKKAGVLHEPEVLVVRLRREATETAEDHEPGEASYSHRFIVGGHWRNQPYPSENIVRQIWIAPYVKGDPSLPLIIKPRRVYQWER